MTELPAALDDARPSTSASETRPRSQVGRMGELYSAAARGQRLTASDRVELEKFRKEFGYQALELARIETMQRQGRTGRSGVSALPGIKRSSDAFHAFAGGGAAAAEVGDSMTRATSAPHLLYNIGVGTPVSRRGLQTPPPAFGGLPRPMYDAWQRGAVIPGMPPPPPQMSAEQKSLLEARRRLLAKEKVQVFRETMRQLGSDYVAGSRWYALGQPPPREYRKRMMLGPGYAPRPHRVSSPRLLSPSASLPRLRSSAAPPGVGTLEADLDDEKGEGEEDFEVGMRQNAMERDAADADQDGKLDFTEFCAFVRDREEGEFTDKELKARFDALDEDGSGQVDMSEYLQWSLKDALARSSSRVVDLFRAWDEDRSGYIDKKEFRKGTRVRAAQRCVLGGRLCVLGGRLCPFGCVQSHQVGRSPCSRREASAPARRLALMSDPRAFAARCACVRTFSVMRCAAGLLALTRGAAGVFGTGSGAIARLRRRTEGDGRGV